MQESQSKLSEREIAQAWAQITVKRWKRNLSRKKVGQMSFGELLRSFQYMVLSSAGGDVLKIEFAFITASSLIWVLAVVPPLTIILNLTPVAGFILSFWG